MAGHSKWANIKHRKGAQDAKRGKVFTRLIKEITVAAKEGGIDEDTNPRLRVAIANAKSENLPKDNIQKALKKVEGGSGEDYSEVTYEGYAPNGIGVFVEATTDNNNRTVANVRSYFNKSGGSLSKNGSLEFIFNRKGVFTIPKGEWDVDELTMELIDGGAEEVEEIEHNKLVAYTSFEDYGNMQSKLEELGIEAHNTSLQRIPNTTTALDLESAKAVWRLIEKIEDDDDVQNVFHNLEMTDELAEYLDSE